MLLYLLSLFLPYSNTKCLIFYYSITSVKNLDCFNLTNQLNNNLMKYSIILPVRNGGEYIKECILNILSQTLDNFNLIILENFSTDGTQAWIESLNDPRIIIIPAEKPLSMQENWSRAAFIDRNEFMTMVGADDVLYPDYLQTIDDLIIKHPGASLYQTHFRFINEEGKTIRNCQPMKEEETAAEFLESICLNKISIMGTGFMMRSSDYTVVGGIPDYPSLLFADFELWIELTRLKYKATAAATCFSYRVHTNSTTASSSYKNYAEGFDRLMLYFEKLILKDKDIAGYINNNWITLINYYCKGSAHKLLRTPLNKRGGISVNDVLNKYQKYAQDMIPNIKYKPTATFSIRLAKFIDSNFLSRELFFLFKKIYNKPIYH